MTEYIIAKGKTSEDLEKDVKFYLLLSFVVSGQAYFDGENHCQPMTKD